MEHSDAHDHASVDGPWAGGWLVAVLAALIAVGLARWLGEIENFAGVIVGLVVFGVYAVLLGNGGVELTATADHGHTSDDHGHGHH